MHAKPTSATNARSDHDWGPSLIGLCGFSNTADLHLTIIFASPLATPPFPILQVDLSPVWRPLNETSESHLGI